MINIIFSVTKPEVFHSLFFFGIHHISYFIYEGFHVLKGIHEDSHLLEYEAISVCSE